MLSNLKPTLNPENKNPLLNTERLLAFSDGVFAIAITLLILEIKIPKHEDLEHYGGLYNYLIHLWPNYLAYVVSFIVIGIYWSNHHWLFTFIHKTNHTFNLIHILFLMTICFLPFTTAILGDFILDHETKNAAVTAYCIGLLFPVPTLILMIFYATRKTGLISKNLNKSFINRLFIKLFAGFIMQVIALLFSFEYPLVSISIIALAFFLYLLSSESPVYDVEKS